MTRPLVSVVIAVKDGERFLASAISSVLEQDYQPFEIIVIDGQSVDNTAPIAKSFEEVRYICQVNQGIADAYNVGVEAARGEFIAFLSHDDLWTPDKLDVQVNYMLNRPGIQYTVARVKFFLEPGCSIPPGFRRELLEGDHVGRIMETLVARRPLFDAIGKFDPQLTISEDADWFARASDHKVPTAVIPQVLLWKRVHDTNASLDVDLGHRDLLKALRRSVTRKRDRRCSEAQGEGSAQALSKDGPPAST
jgi:glycosyltransferase involved in cell wall biosynthesis